MSQSHPTNKEGKKPSKKRAKSSRQIREELEAIYGKKRTQEAFSKLEQAPRGLGATHALIRIVLLLLFGAAVVWAGFLFWSQGMFQDGDILRAQIDGPQEVTAGEEVFYRIAYENNGSVPMADLEMELSLPADFQLLQATPEPSAGMTWDIGSLGEGSDGEIQISGIFRSETQTEQSLQTLFTYKPANFSSSFQTIQTTKITVNASVLSLSIDGPEKALAGDTLSYIINVQNTGSRSAENLQVRASLPEDFTLTEATPDVTLETQAEWTLETLEPGELAAITLTGQFTASAVDNQYLSASIGFSDDGTYLAQNQVKHVTDVLGGSVLFHLVVNGGAEDQTAELGDDLRVSIDYQNGGTETIEGLSFALDLSTPDDRGTPIDWSRAELAGGTRTGARIVWTAEEIEGLEELSADASGIIDLLLPIRPALTSERSDVVSLDLSATVQKVGDLTTPRTISSSPLVISLNSDARFSSQALYFTDGGDAIGTGPLPPRVNQTTTYHLLWNIENTLHDLKDITVSTTLPPDVRWNEDASARVGTLTYNPTTRLVSWNLDELIAGDDRANASFTVSITPQEHDVGTFVKLTNATSFKATDVVTGGVLTQAQHIRTTELPTDTYAAGKGVVLGE